MKAFAESSDDNYPVLIRAKDGQSVKSKYVLTCGGLQSDKLAELSGTREAPLRGPKDFVFFSNEREKIIHLSPLKSFLATLQTFGLFRKTSGVKHTSKRKPLRCSLKTVRKPESLGPFDDFD